MQSFKREIWLNVLYNSCRCNRTTSDISLTVISGRERLVKRISVLSRVFIILFCVIYLMRLIHYLRVVVIAPTSQCHNIHLLLLGKMSDVWKCEKYIESVVLSHLNEVRNVFMKECTKYTFPVTCKCRQICSRKQGTFSETHFLHFQQVVHMIVLVRDWKWDLISVIMFDFFLEYWTTIKLFLTLRHVSHKQMYLSIVIPFKAKYLSR